MESIVDGCALPSVAGLRSVREHRTLLSAVLRGIFPN